MELKTESKTEILNRLIEMYGPIPTVRVVRGKGRDRWGAVRYEIRSVEGRPTACVVKSLSLVCHTLNLAELHAARIALDENRLLCQASGSISEGQAAAILNTLDY